MKQREEADHVVRVHCHSRQPQLTSDESQVERFCMQVVHIPPQTPFVFITVINTLISSIYPFED